MFAVLFGMLFGNQRVPLIGRSISGAWSRRGRSAFPVFMYTAWIIRLIYDVDKSKPPEKRQFGLLVKPILWRPKNWESNRAEREQKRLLRLKKQADWQRMHPLAWALLLSALVVVSLLLLVPGFITGGNIWGRGLILSAFVCALLLLNASFQADRMKPPEKRNLATLDRLFHWRSEMNDHRSSDL